jgi:hypothetical protein
MRNSQLFQSLDNSAAIVRLGELRGMVYQMILDRLLDLVYELPAMFVRWVNSSEPMTDEHEEAAGDGDICGGGDDGEETGGSGTGADIIAEEKDGVAELPPPSADQIKLLCTDICKKIVVVFISLFF